MRSATPVSAFRWRVHDGVPGSWPLHQTWPPAYRQLRPSFRQINERPISYRRLLRARRAVSNRSRFRLRMIFHRQVCCGGTARTIIFKVAYEGIQNCHACRAILQRSGKSSSPQVEAARGGFANRAGRAPVTTATSTPARPIPTCWVGGENPSFGEETHRRWGENMLPPPPIRLRRLPGKANSPRNHASVDMVGRSALTVTVPSLKFVRFPLPPAEIHFPTEVNRCRAPSSRTSASSAGGLEPRLDLPGIKGHLIAVKASPPF